ncbi:hypothetical protein [Longispora albida]|uniref:hypothetical protein n=1 Tax=Longispora albida TaxID=203523 RepID=UPI00035EA6EA|nr:hypothetical protein [Longispora albida]
MSKTDHKHLFLEQEELTCTQCGHTGLTEWFSVDPEERRFTCPECGFDNHFDKHSLELEDTGL